MTGMEIQEIFKEGTHLLALRGKLDADGARALAGYFEGVVARGEGRVLLDFSGVDYVSSVGVRALLLGTKQLQGVGGSAEIAGLNPQLLQFFQMSGLSTIFPIHSSVEQALDPSASSGEKP